MLAHPRGLIDEDAVALEMSVDARSDSPLVETEGRTMTNFGESWAAASHELAVSALKRQGQKAPPAAQPVRIGPYLVQSGIPCPTAGSATKPSGPR